jgi:hypothetical protein
MVTVGGPLGAGVGVGFAIGVGDGDGEAGDVPLEHALPMATIARKRKRRISILGRSP